MYERFEFNVRFHRDQSACEVKLVKKNETNIIFVKEINEGMSICNAFGDLFPQVLVHFGLTSDSPICWIEYWGKDAQISREDEYSLVCYELDNGKAHSPYWRYLGNSEQAVIDAVTNL
jgi:hypothetical protein